jgi:hypothetical protein
LLFCNRYYIPFAKNVLTLHQRGYLIREMIRQKFDIGDIVLVTHPNGQRGFVLKTELVNANVRPPDEQLWHVDEYKCQVRFFESGIDSWVRAKWLQHLSKVNG